MKKLLLLFAMQMSLLMSFAQTKMVTGRVTEENGNGIPFATITIKGSKEGASADQDGKFSIRLKGTEILVISAVGFSDKEVDISGNTNLSVSLVKSSSDLKEVVVTTGLGIKKSTRVTPYSAQVIKSEDLSITRHTNLNNALAGKVAGVQTRSQSGAKLNSETFLRIRGGLGIGDRAAIYVVDGTITNSFDINPDDVEDLTVLKGANATALFGSQATGGAIVINTKKRNPSSNGIGIELNSAFTAEEVYVLPGYQNLYAGGANPDLAKFSWKAGMPDDWKAMDGKYYHDYTDDASWGPRMSGQEYIPWYAWYPNHSRSFKTGSLSPQPSNNHDFWRTGITANNNVSLSKSGQGGTMRLSYTNQFQSGILPNSNSDRHTVFFTGGMDLSNHFTAQTNLSFTSLELKGDFADGYANNAGANFNQWFHRDLDMGILHELRDLRSPYGTMATWNLRYNPDGYDPNNPQNFYKANYWDNPYSYYAQRPRVTYRNALTGDASLTYKLNNNFRVKGTVRKSQRNEHIENIATSLLQASGLQTQNTASYATAETNLQRYDFELIGYFNKKFGDFNVSVNGGGNIFKFKQDEVTANTVSGLNVPDLYAISNSKNPATITNLRRRQQINSLLGSGDIEYKKLASISFAVRNDWGSTLSDLKPSLFYPSLGASFIVTELLKTKPSWFNYGKVFGSWGRKPESLDIFATNFTYAVNANQWNGNFLMGVPNLIPDPALTGSLITTMEVGFDTRFLKNRLGLNFVYYHETADKIPVDIPVNGASGYSVTTINAAKVERSGIELILNAKPIAGKDFSWEFNTTFAYLIDNPVSRLFGDQTRIPIPLPPGQPQQFGARFAQAYQLLGEDWGQLFGNGLKRNAAGIPLVNPATGLFVGDPTKEYGSIVPKTTGGLINSFSYKDFSFSFALDYQVGGKFFSLSESWGHYSGLFEATAAPNDKGFNVRDAVPDGGGVHVVGVSTTDEKTPVDIYVDAQTYFHQFYNASIAEPFVHDLTYVKLREVSLGYNIPLKKIGKVSKYVQGAKISLIARNPWLIYSDSKDFDPSEISNLYGEDGQLPGTRSLGFNLSLRF